MSLKTALIDGFIISRDFVNTETGYPCREGTDDCEVCTYCICWRAVFVYGGVFFLSGLGVGLCL